MVAEQVPDQVPDTPTKSKKTTLRFLRTQPGLEEKVQRCMREMGLAEDEDSAADPPEPEHKP